GGELARLVAAVVRVGDGEQSCGVALRRVGERLSEERPPALGVERRLRCHEQRGVVRQATVLTGQRSVIELLPQLVPAAGDVGSGEVARRLALPPPHPKIKNA